MPETITVEGKQVPPGDYKVEWAGTGPNVEVKILKGKETVATAPARLVQTPTKAAVDSYGITKQQDGARVLSSIYFGGKNLQPGNRAELSAGHSGSRRDNAVTDAKK